MGSLAIYTAIIGGYDSYIEPRPGGRSFVITDGPLKRAAWSTAHVTVLPRRPFPDPVRTARWFKIMFHKGPVQNFETSVWVDGCISTRNADVQRLAKEYLSDADLVLFRHPTIDCIYEGAEHAIECGTDDPAVIRAQLARYRAEGYPEHHGLGETSVLFRRNTLAVRAFCEAWWEEVRTGSRRDQVSFNYVADRMKLRYRYFAGKRTPFGFVRHKHLKPYPPVA